MLQGDKVVCFVSLLDVLKKKGLGESGIWGGGGYFGVIGEPGLKDPLAAGQATTNLPVVMMH